MKQPVVIQRYNSRVEAETAKSALDANGLESFVLADDGGAQYPGLGFSRGVELLVEAEQLERAREVLTPRHGSRT